MKTLTELCFINVLTFLGFFTIAVSRWETEGKEKEKRANKLFGSPVSRKAMWLA